MEQRETQEIALSASKSSEEVIQLVGFMLENESFGIPIQKVQEINRLTEVTKMPKTPPFVEGVVNLRGRVIPVINLRMRLGLEKGETTRDNRLIIVELSGKVLGFVVDAVEQVMRVPTALIEAAPASSTGVAQDYISGVARLEEGLLILLDFDKLLKEDEVRAIAAPAH